MNLDQNIQDQHLRKLLVNSVLSQQKNLSAEEIKDLSDYLLYINDKNQTVKQRAAEYPIITKNRDTTISKRQTSYEGLIEKLRNGEDGIYNIINNDKNQLLDYKDPITQEDIDKNPLLRECLQIISSLEEQRENTTSTSRKRKLKTTIIDFWKQAYLIKGTAQSGKSLSNTSNITGLAKLSIPEKIYFDDKGIPHNDEILSFFNVNSVLILLQNYQAFKEETWEMLNSDLRWHLLDFEKIVDDALEKKYPLFYDVLIWKIDGLSNKEIKEKIFIKYQEDHSEQYYSTIWTKKIPKLIVEQAQKNYLTWYYTYKEPLGHKWKTCGRCGRSLLAHPFFFSPNSSSKDGYYSICKECRKKGKK